MASHNEQESKRFAAALDRVVSDRGLREQLERQPLETLEKLGLPVDDQTRATLRGKRLSEVLRPAEAREAIPSSVVRIIVGIVLPPKQ